MMRTESGTPCSIVTQPKRRHVGWKIGAHLAVCTTGKRKQGVKACVLTRCWTRLLLQGEQCSRIMQQHEAFTEFFSPLGKQRGHLKTKRTSALKT